MPGPPSVQHLQMSHLRDWQGGQMPRSCPGGGWAQVELTDALLPFWTMRGRTYEEISNWLDISTRRRFFKPKLWKDRASCAVYCKFKNTKNILETFRFEDENDYEYEIWFKVFSRIVKK